MNTAASTIHSFNHNPQMASSAAACGAQGWRGPVDTVNCPDCLALLTPEQAQRPDPAKTGPCELRLSFACTGAGYERYDPRDMLAPETSFRTPKIICVECNDMAATIYVRELHS